MQQEGRCEPEHVLTVEPLTLFPIEPAAPQKSLKVIKYEKMMRESNKDKSVRVGHVVKVSDAQ